MNKRDALLVTTQIRRCVIDTKEADTMSGTMTGVRSGSQGRLMRRIAGGSGPVVLAALLLLTGTVAATAHEIYALTVEQLRAGMMKASAPDKKGFVLVDVRTPGEHAEGFIPGTDANIDYRELGERHRELGLSLDDHVVVYCQSGHRAGIAAKTLTDLGYRHVYSVVGSMKAWREAGFPVDQVK